MRLGKRKVAVILSFCMVLGMAAPVSAEETGISVFEESQIEKTGETTEEGKENVNAADTAEIKDQTETGKAEEGQTGEGEKPEEEKPEEGKKPEEEKPGEEEKPEEEKPIEVIRPQGSHKGWYYSGWGWYYYGDNGEMATGWVLDRNKWYYLDGSNEKYPGLMVSNGKKDVDGRTYFFDRSGAMRTGWVYTAEGWYYANAAGDAAKGWKYLNGVWYYLDGANKEYPGLMVSNGKKDVSGRTYFFDGSGAMRTGWVYTAEGWYYADTAGDAAKGWKYINGVWYYLDGANKDYPGLMVANCNKVINNAEYAFDSSGAMRTGWYYNKGWFYFNVSGAMAKGWVWVDGKWYYLDPQDGGRMTANQWKDINGKRYYLNASGAMAEKWLYQGGWYYLGVDGAMRTGWQYVDNYWYYLYTENDSHGGSWGKMAANTKIDGWRVGRNGQYAQAYTYAENVLNQIGWSLRAAYNYSAGLAYENNSRNASPGSDYFATYGFKNGRGNCYVMATTFYYMADLLGYDVHWIDGGVALRSGRTSPHSWCEIVIDGTTYVFDPDFTNETGRNGYQITYGTSGTWRYANYRRMN